MTQELKNFFSDNVQVKINKGGFRLIEEKNKKPTKQFVSVDKEQLVVLQLDIQKTEVPRKFFFREIHKICDYALILEEWDKILVILVELKSTKPDGAKTQLKYGQLFCEYLVKIYNIQQDFRKSIDYKGIVFQKRKNLKATITRRGKKKVKKSKSKKGFIYYTNNNMKLFEIIDNSSPMDK